VKLCSRLSFFVAATAIDYVNKVSEISPTVMWLMNFKLE
jgi:hypothetical protein